ncbi:MAG: hypothetical protein IJ447_01985 [Clostridia bacterium]|nr:hypothetical protein [Clostridia bacterium]
MEIIFCYIPLAAVLATMFVGVFMSFLSLVHDHQQQKKDIANLEEDNLTLARRNQALRELLQKQTEQLLQK